MRNRRLLAGSGAGVLLLTGLRMLPLSAAPAPVAPVAPAAPRHVRVEIAPVAHPNVRPAAGTDPGTIGNVVLVLPDGSRKPLTTTGMAFHAKTAANGTIIGWTEGQILPYPDRDQHFVPNVGYPAVPTFFPKCIVVRREGKLTRIVPHKLYRATWKFFKNGRQIGVTSDGSHGPTYYELFDTATGKPREAHASFEEKLPAWAQEL